LIRQRWTILHGGAPRAGSAASVPLLAATLLAALILALQIASGAYHCETIVDESSHYVSGLMLHDYVLSGLAQSPLAYIRIWHAHYPLVAIGHWPPFYYLVEAAWMLAFSPTRTSMLLLSACVTLATALLLYASLARRAGPLVAAAAAGVFVAAPMVQAGTQMLMLDVPTALACLLAMLAYVRYLDRARARDAVLFAVLAVIAMMVKGNGACLALLPPCAMLIGRRFDLLRRVSFWLPLPIVGVLAGPWYFLTYDRAAAGFRFAWGLDFAALAATSNFGYLRDSLGLPIVLLAAAGLLDVAARPRRAGTVAVGAAALFAAVWMFQVAVPASLQDRYLAPALPPLLILAAHALATMLEPLAPPRMRAPLAACILGLAFLLTSAALVRKQHSGVMEAVTQILAHPVPGNPAVLISADQLEETQAIMEIALRDTDRPHLFAVRGSRLLGGGGYNARDYQPRFHTVAEVMAAIDAQAIPIVLLRAGDGPCAWEHVCQMRAATAAYPDRWHLLGRVDVPDKPPVLLYRIVGNETRPADAASLLALSAPRGL
jgi:Dolichyl-phosphate-mannose-protein mannosyltransferase